MNPNTVPRVAWLVPSAEYGAYWPPILDKLAQVFNLKFYTGRLWPKFDPDAPGTSVIEVVGETQFLEHQKSEAGYNRGFLLASPAIILHLLQFKPQLIFASGFSLWTLFALLLKLIGQWKVVLVYEGSAPNVDFRDSAFRLFFRRRMVRFADTFISNSQAGKNYLVDVLGVSEQNISANPYMVPDAQALLQRCQQAESFSLLLQHPVFLFVGQLIQRKGLHLLLAACARLREQGYTQFTLLVIGEGPQRQELELLSQQQGLEGCVHWLGWVAYGQLGQYFQTADVFVFPTLEDTWGMVVLEAMAFGKPVLCSKWAGAIELVTDGENGYRIDPYDTQELAQAMQQLIDNPELIPKMGATSQQLMAQYTPETAAKFLSGVTSAALSGEQPFSIAKSLSGSQL